MPLHRNECDCPNLQNLPACMKDLIAEQKPTGREDYNRDGLPFVADTFVVKNLKFWSKRRLVKQNS